MKIVKFNIGDFKKINWFRAVSRELSPFLNSMYRVGYGIRNKELSFDNRMNKSLIIGSLIFTSIDDFERLKRSMILESKKNKKFIRNYILTLERDCANYLKFTKKLKSDSHRKFSDNELHKLFSNYIKETFRIASHMWPPLGIEDYVLEKLKNGFSKYVNPRNDFDEYNKCIQILTSSDKLSLIQLKKISILSLAIKLKNNKINLSSNDINKEYEKYFWIDDRGLSFICDSKNKFIKEIVIASKKNPENELEQIKNEFRLIKNKKKRLIKKYKLDADLINYIDCANSLPHMRFLRVDVIIESLYLLRDNFLRQICNSLGITILEFKLLYYWEILDGLKFGKINRENIEKRKSNYNFLIIGDSFTEFDDKKAKNILNLIEKKEDDILEIKGSIACLGNVRGKVKIILSSKEFHTFKKGNVLVTGMTMPEYVPIMKKSVAIITDEGGLTCHAAIVSRELNIPCIIGTKIATKVLKDGDLVEVDANKGIVRILK